MNLILCRRNYIDTKFSQFTHELQLDQYPKRWADIFEDAMQEYQTKGDLLHAEYIYHK